MPQPLIPEILSYCCLVCGRKCRSSGGLTQHQKAMHPKISAPKEAIQHKRVRHPYVTGSG